MLEPACASVKGKTAPAPAGTIAGASYDAPSCQRRATSARLRPATHFLIEAPPGFG
jgi:hypothetical protein